MPSAHDHPIISSPPPPFLCHPYHNFLILEKPASYSSTANCVINADSPSKDSGLNLSISAGIANNIADHSYPASNYCVSRANASEDRTHRKSGKRGSNRSLIGGAAEGSSIH